MKSNFQITATLKWEVERGPQNREKEELRGRKTDRKTGTQRDNKKYFPTYRFMFTCVYVSLCFYVLMFIFTCVHTCISLDKYTHPFLFVCFVFCF